jgi:hypothetical protein
LKVGELFVQIGLKGAEQVAKGMSDVAKRFKSLADLSWETKAAVLGAIYGLERFAQMAAGNGMAMRNFNAETGLSVETLQRWQIAGKQFGITNEEMAGSIKNVQSVMGKMLSGQNAPSGWADISRTVGLDITRVQDTYYVMEKLREYAKKTKLPVTLANEYISSFVGNEKVVGMLRRTTVELDKIPRSMIMTQRELENQAKLAHDWELLWLRMQQGFQRFAMTYAPSAVKLMGGGFDQIIDLAKNIRKLSNEFPFLEKVAIAAGLAIAGAFKPITTIIAGIMLFLNEWQKYQEGKENLFSTYSDAFKGMMQEWQEEKPAKPDEAEANKYRDKIRAMFGMSPLEQSNVVPPMKGPTENKSGTSVNINQNLNFQHEGKDAHKTGVSVQEAIKGAFYQMPSNFMVK